MGSPDMTLKEIYSPVQREMERVEEVLREEMTVDSPHVRDLVDHVSGYRGKRMRPALALLTGKSLGNLGEGHIYLGSIVELIHTATLIHDDILDEAVIRRGIPTVHTKWDTEISVLLGDYIFSRAFTVLARFDGHQCLPLLTETTNKMCKGELIQLRSRYQMGLTEEDYLRIAELKTASLCGVSTQLAARLAGATPDIVERFRVFGTKLGIAFQVTDDCLDIMGSEKVVGKSLGTDLGQGKLTLPVIRLLERATAKVKEEAAQILKDGFLLPRRQRFQELVRQSGALDFSLDEAARLLKEAREAISPVPDSPSKASLLGLCDYVLRREL